MRRPSSAPFLYASMFSRKQDLIFAGGAGKNEFRIFDYNSGNLVCIISDMERSIMCMDIGNKSTQFAFGSGDSCVRVMDIAS